MPYTPPSQRSPASTASNSPVISRNHSYVGEQFFAKSNASLPRSVSSTSYLNRHRRSPSINSNNSNQSPVEDAKAYQSASEKSSSSNGAITTPPDSAQSSDDEDRGRQLGTLAELAEALQSIEKLNRTGSPVRNADESSSNTKQTLLTTPPLVRAPLSPEARKISHSRSSSDIHLSSHASTVTPSPGNTSEDSDVEDDELRIKPPLLRKKSGELVKPALRPSSRRRPSSMPGTPTYSKAVHFNEDIEQVRHFLQVDRPIAVSAGSSPVDNYESEGEYPFFEEGYSKRKVEWELKLANFPSESLQRKTALVRVERIFLSADTKTLIGTVAVANIAFHKAVVARFTLDYWKTTSEICAEYNNDVRKKHLNDGYDRFNFSIKLADQANLESKTMLLCVRYSVNGRDYWDNNGSMNYQVDFNKKSRSKGTKQALGGPLGAIPRSRHSPTSSSRPRSFPSGLDDDFENGFDSKFRFGISRSPLSSDSSNPPLRLKNKSSGRNGSVLSDEARKKSAPNGQAFSTRYDFSSSLNAALSNAQNALGDRSGLKLQETPSGASQDSPRSAPAQMAGSRPDTLSSEKPDVKSAEYNELIQKFCFFGSASGKTTPQPSAQRTTAVASSPQVSSPKIEEMTRSNGTTDKSEISEPKPLQSRVVAPQVDGVNERSSSRNRARFLSRSSSPGPFTGADLPERTESPMKFGYPYNHNNFHGGMLSDTPTPQAILG